MDDYRVTHRSIENRRHKELMGDVNSLQRESADKPDHQSEAWDGAGGAAVTRWWVRCRARHPVQPSQGSGREATVTHLPTLPPKMSHNDCQVFCCCLLICDSECAPTTGEKEWRRSARRCRRERIKKRNYTRFSRGGGAGREDTE